jgi:hypothetical protein
MTYQQPNILPFPCLYCMFFYVFLVFYIQIPVLKLQYNAWLDLCTIDSFSQTLICNEASFMSISINKFYKINMNLMYDTTSYFCKFLFTVYIGWFQ